MNLLCVQRTCSDVKRTRRGAADMPLVLTSGKYLYRAIITLYMLEIAPPVETRHISTLDSDRHTLTITQASAKALLLF